MASLLFPNHGCVCSPAISHGSPFSQFIGEYLGTCVWTTSDKVGLIAGYITLALVSFIQLPQIWLNFKRKDSSGLSRNMLLLWNLGDAMAVSGLVLCGLTYTSAFMLSVFSACIDWVLTIQFFLYLKKKNEENQNGEKNNVDQSYSEPLLERTPSPFDVSSSDTTLVVSGNGTGSGRNMLRIYITIIAVISCLLQTSTASSPIRSIQSQQNQNNPKSEKFSLHQYGGANLVSNFEALNFELSNFDQNGHIFEDPVPNYCETPYSGELGPLTDRIVGYFFAIASSLIYTPSQWGQIYHHYKVKSAHAIATPSLIMAIFAYNLYFIAYLAPTKVSDDHKWGEKFWFGIFPSIAAFFCLMMACLVMLGQKYKYWNNKPEGEEEGLCEENNQSDNFVENKRDGLDCLQPERSSIAIN
jgi:uncharacterized protein with PQ loop repeat